VGASLTRCCTCRRRGRWADWWGGGLAPATLAPLRRLVGPAGMHSHQASGIPNITQQLCRPLPPLPRRPWWSRGAATASLLRRPSSPRVVGKRSAPAVVGVPQIGGKSFDSRGARTRIGVYKSLCIVHRPSFCVFLSTFVSFRWCPQRAR
jgi:hypothetical protein